MQERTPLPSGKLLEPGGLPPRAPLSKKTRSIPWWQWPLQGWLFLSAPSEVAPDAPLAKREAVRRGRVASVVLFFVILLVVLPLPSALGNPVLLTTLIAVIIWDIVALLINRSGRTTLAGVMVVIGIEVGLGSSILTVPGGLGASNLPLFDLMVQALCVAVSLLAPQTVFLVAAINSAFIIVVLFAGPVTPELSHLVHTQTDRILVQPITLQIIVAIVTFVWVNSANHAIKRADRAEEIEQLQRRELERQQQDIDQKQQIEYGIDQILKTHVKVANGDFTARAPLAQDNILWQVARSLNNLLARLQGYSQMANELRRAQQELGAIHSTIGSSEVAQRELQKTKEAAGKLITSLRAMRSGRVVAPPPPSGTVIDEVVAVLSANSAMEHRDGGLVDGGSVSKEKLSNSSIISPDQWNGH